MSYPQLRTLSVDFNTQFLLYINFTVFKNIYNFNNNKSCSYATPNFIGTTVTLGSQYLHSTNFYSTKPYNIVPVVVYKNADLDKLQILQENKGKCGVYR
jgi:hypothetical protein